MTHTEGIQRLQTINGNAVRLLHQLEVAAALKQSLHEEYDRVMPERTQKTMTLFELTVYSPTIEEVWKETGLSRLKIEGAISKRWREVFEAVVFKTSKYTA
jgi:hypothetical protein